MVRFMSLIVMVGLFCTFSLVITGCNTTFEQRKQVYAKLGKVVLEFAKVAGKPAATAMVDKLEADQKISPEAATKLKEQIKNYNPAKESAPEASSNHCRRFPMLC
jgi:hypothetical protein